jgi:hypothetical protein
MLLSIAIYVVVDCIKCLVDGQEDG